jgi:hypothetical protein
MLSDALVEYGDGISDAELATVAFGCLSPHHATQFRAFVKQVRGRYQLSAILDGKARWPERPEDRDLLYFLSQSFRARLAKELPAEREAANGEQRELAHRAKALLRDLAALSLEIAQMAVAGESDGQPLPGWFLVEVVRDLPRLAAERDGTPR